MVESKRVFWELFRILYNFYYFSCNKSRTKTTAYQNRVRGIDVEMTERPIDARESNRLQFYHLNSIIFN